MKANNHQPSPVPRRRMLRVRALGLAAAAFVAIATATGCSADDPVADAAHDVEADLDQEELDALVDAGVPGAVLYIKDPGAEPIQLAAGVSNIETNAELSTSDGFRIGSVTKPYIATMVMQLAEEGELSLDDTVESILPGLLPNGDEITVGDLLGHRSGLAEYLEDPSVRAPYLKGDLAYEWKPEDLVEISVKLGPRAKPGTDVVYSNANYTVLALIVEAVTDNTLEDELTERIVEPLNLDDTSLATGTEIEGPHSNGYLATDARLQDVTGVSSSHYWGAGNIVASAADVATFYEALLGGELVSDESLAEMKVTVPEEGAGIERGLGLARGVESCGKWYGHDGAVPGYNSVARVMDSGRVVVLLMNSVTLEDTVGGPEAQAALQKLYEDAVCR